MYVLPSPTYPLTVRWPDLKLQREAQLSKLERAELALSQDVAAAMERLKDLGTRLGVPETYLDPLKARMVDVAVSLPLSESAAPLVAIYRVLCKTVKCRYRVLVHSSVANRASQAHRTVLQGEGSDTAPQLTLTVVWKGEDICPTPTMMVSANQVPVAGMANILRLLTRLFAQELYEGRGPSAAAQVDTWLDAATQQVVNGNSKERAAFLRQLNARLGSAEWLVGDTLSLADLFAFLALCQMSEVKAPGNVQKWAARCTVSPPLCSLPGVSPPRGLLPSI